MRFTAAQIAEIINGRTEGDPSVLVNAFGKIEEATSGQLSFLANPKYEDYLYTTGASVVLLSENLVLRKNITATLIRVKDPYQAFATLLAFYQNQTAKIKTGREEPAFVAGTATLGKNLYLGAFAYIGNHATIGDNVKIYPNVYVGDQVRIGNNTTLYPGVVIYQDCVIGDQVTIHAGAVIGSDGFGFAPQADGSYQKIPQIGNVVIENQVEVGANTTIDRATIGSTVIREGTKLDNLIQIAHNVEVGKSTVIAAQTGISGSTKVGNRVMIGGQVGVTGHIRIADGAKVSAQSGVTKTIRQQDAVVTGTPAQEYHSALRAQAIQRNLPDLEKRVKELEKMVAQLLEERNTPS